MAWRYLFLWWRRVAKHRAPANARAEELAPTRVQALVPLCTKRISVGALFELLAVDENNPVKTLNR